MQTTIALLGLAAVAFAAPQASSGTKAPSAAAPAGCTPDFSGTFEIQAETVIPNKKRDACGGAGTLVSTLKGGILTDSQGRQGNIVSNNNQFQYDPAPGQPGFIYNAGFSACANGSLALGGTTVFYQCKSGGFYNIYQTASAQQCEPIQLGIIPCGASASSAAVGQKTDGQPTGTSVAPVGQKTDGQPTGTSVAAVGQKTDGQPTATGAVPVSQISDGQPQAKSAVPLSQITDGQIQVVTAVPVSQISDGQIQATSAVKASAPVSQISDGQVQATTAVAPKPSAPISQISDGQIQATSAVAPISQISDGQIQATGAATATPKAPNATSTPLQVTNSASGFNIGSQLAAIVLGAVAVAFL